MMDTPTQPEPEAPAPEPEPEPETPDAPEDLDEHGRPERDPHRMAEEFYKTRYGG